LLDQLHLIVVVEDLEAPGQPDVLAEPPEQPGTAGVERADPHRVGALAQQLAEALAHLPRRLVGERHREDRPWWSAGLDEPCDAMDEHAGLPGAGAREDHQRPIAVLDRGALFGIEWRALHPACLAPRPDSVRTSAAPRSGRRPAGSDWSCCRSSGCVRSACWS